MNPFNLVYLFFVENGEEVYAWGRERITHTLRALTAGVVFSAILLVIGIILGMIGERFGDPGFVRAASLVVAISGFLASLAFALFWLKTAVLTHLLVAATNVANAAYDKIPKVQLDSADAFLKWMRGVTGWLTMVCLYGALVPLWANLYWTLIAATVFLFLSAAMTAEWVKSESTKKIVIALAVLMLVIATVNLATPGFAHGVRESIASVTGSVDAFKEGHVAMAEVERKAASAEREQDRALVERFRKRQYEIRARSYNECSGKFCSPAEEAEYRELDRKIGQLKDGTYWNGKPEGREVRKPGSRVVPSPRQPSGPHRLSKEQADRVFSELDKYNDL